MSKLKIYELDKNGYYVNPQQVINDLRERIEDLKLQIKELRRRKYYNKIHE